MKVIFISSTPQHHRAFRLAIRELENDQLQFAVAYVNDCDIDPQCVSGMPLAREWAETNLRYTSRRLDIPVPCVTLCTAQDRCREYVCCAGMSPKGETIFREMTQLDGISSPDAVVEILKEIITVVTNTEPIT